jgi:hypothetical protein
MDVDAPRDILELSLEHISGKAFGLNLVTAFTLPSCGLFNNLLPAVGTGVVVDFIVVLNPVYEPCNFEEFIPILIVLSLFLGSFRLDLVHHLLDQSVVIVLF